MKFTGNKIYKEEGETSTKAIKEAYNHADRVIFIRDERDTIDYGFENQRMASLKYITLIQNINQKKIIVTPSKFTLLSWQGLLDVNNYDLIIIRLEDLKPEFIYAFKIFYMERNTMSQTKPSILVFLKNIKEGSHVYFQSIIYKEAINNSLCNDTNDNITCICIPTTISQELINYVKVKDAISAKEGGTEFFLKRIKRVEEECLETAIEFINSKVDINKLSGIEITPTIIEEAKLLQLKMEHNKIISKYANDGNVIVHVKNVKFDKPNVFSLLKTPKDKINDISTLSTLIIIDELENIESCEICFFNKLFTKTFAGTYNGNYDYISPLDDKCIENLDLKGCNSEKEFKTCLIHEILSFRFKKVVYVKSGERYPTDFLRNIVMNNKSGLTGLIKYCNKDRVEYYTKENKAVISLDFSIYLLEHILYLITKCFEKHFLFFNNPKCTKTYENFENEQFICIIELPRLSKDDLFNMKIRSKPHSLKKDACKDASYTVLIRLYESGFLDDHLFPVDDRFINQNEMYFTNIHNTYGIVSKDLNVIKKEILKMVEEHGDDFSVALERFRKDNYVDWKSPLKSAVVIDDILRKQPDCFKEFGSEFCVYQFNSGPVGLACTGGFEESINFKHVQIDFLGKFSFSEHERELLTFYQIIIFSINFKRIITIESKAREYCYFMLPMKDKAINFEYIQSLYSSLLVDCVYEVKDENILANYLLFNPIMKNFLLYEKPSNVKLSDKIPSSLQLRITKMRKKLTTIDGDDVDTETKLDEMTYFEYFKTFYGCKLVKFVNGRNIVFNATVYCPKNRTKTPEIHSGEVIFVTTIPKTIKKEYQEFVNYFYHFEHCAMANEFIKDKKLNVSLEAVSSALSQSEIHLEEEIDLGYERLEFIGDSVLKFAIVKHLFISKGYDLSKMVKTKDELINNSHLYSVAQDLNLRKYISLIKNSENLFQPPAITKLSDLKDEDSNLREYLECLKGWGAFKNNNQEYFALKFNKKQTPENKNITNKKVYADIIEAMIGVHYNEHGFDVAWEFIKLIGITDIFNIDKTSDGVENPPMCLINEENHKDTEFKDEVKHVLDVLGLFKSKKSSTLSTSSSKHYLYCEYDEVLTLSKAKQIEKLIGYKFKNIGLLEKAVVHPSYQDNMFGSERFQKLELVGDCFLDLKVTDYIFKNYPEANPCELHTLRKSFVNNYTFATILFKTGLNDLIATGLSKKHADFSKNKVSKVYSDIFESIAGAVVLDNDFSLKKTQKFFDKMLILMKENSRDC